MPKQPKTASPTKSPFNGDVIRPDDSQGFDKSRAAKGLRTVEGTRAPSVDPGVQPPRQITFVTSAGASFPVARLGKDVQQT